MFTLTSYKKEKWKEEGESEGRGRENGREEDKEGIRPLTDLVLLFPRMIQYLKMISLQKYTEFS